LWVPLAAVVVVGIVLLSIGLTSDSESTDEPSAKQVASANKLIGELGVPAGATRDVYDTACGIPHVTYCVTSAKATPEQLMDAVLTEFRLHGGSVKDRECLTPGKRNDTLGLLGTCLAKIRYEGAELTAEADNVTPLGVKNPSWVFVFPPSASDITETDGPTKPLGSWDSLKLLPAGWAGKATCTVGTTAACTGYKLTLTRPGDAIKLMAPMRAAIRAAGYRVDNLTCSKPTATNPGCGLAARRFRTVGGKDVVMVTVYTHQTTATQMTFTMRVGDVAPPKKVSPGTVVPSAKS
jgi:hypothetical protein